MSSRTFQLRTLENFKFESVNIDSHLEQMHSYSHDRKTFSS
jgi:hypothetical protein